MSRIAVVIAAAIFMIAPASALAQSSSTCQGYSPQTSGAVSGTCTQSATASVTTVSQSTSTLSSQSASTLPFTGLDLSLLVVGSVVLVGTGLVVRRFSRRLG